MQREHTFRKLIKNTSTTKEKLFLSAVYLFSLKGYDNVGIRKICRFINIRESSFYNHFKGKDILLAKILERLSENIEKSSTYNKETENAVETGNVGLFFNLCMQHFTTAMDIVTRTSMQIALKESFTNPETWKITQKLFFVMGMEFIESGLKIMQQNDHIKQCDIKLILTEYYYGYMGLLNEYISLEIWSKDLTDIQLKIFNHMRFFSSLLKKDN